MGRTFGRTEKYFGIGLGIAAVIALVFLLMLTQTDWGRRHVLAFGLDQLASRVHGHVAIGEINGNLLSGARLTRVVITDTAGRPFLNADTVTMRYSMRSLLRKHLLLEDIRIVDAVIVLDQPPNEEWNFARIFPVGPPKPHRGPGFGAWVVIDNMQVKNSTAIVRAVRPAADTAPNNRMWIVKVPGGYQSVSEFLNVNGTFPLMRLSDPDSANRLITVQSLSMVALPFKPPGIDVSSLSGRFIVRKDSVVMDSIRLRTPGSIVSGIGAYAMSGVGGRFQLTIPKANLADVRFLRPDAPAGNGSLSLAYASNRSVHHIITSNMNLRAEGATVRGLLDITIGNAQYQIGPSDF
ncbi:MAG TPA: hypothetical protein VM100_02975, partial [Longimicrobiales bacterium]|nr:hypothetical protein [Longimicrobiales bacterium]